MGCYCYDQFVGAGNYNAGDITFTDVNPYDTNLYCSTWIENYVVEITVKYGAPALISIINALVSAIFNLIVPFEYNFTKNSMTSSIFNKLTVLQFCNTAVVLLLTSLYIK